MSEKGGGQRAGGWRELSLTLDPGDPPSLTTLAQPQPLLCPRLGPQPPSSADPGPVLSSGPGQREGQKKGVGPGGFVFALERPSSGLLGPQASGGPREVGVEWGGSFGGEVLKPKDQEGSIKYKAGGHSPEAKTLLLTPVSIGNATLLLSSDSSPLILVS